MSIDSLHGVGIDDLYTTDGKDVWAVHHYCEEPTITLYNLRTGGKVGGAVGCLNLKPFVKITMPEVRGAGDKGDKNV